MNIDLESNCCYYPPMYDVDETIDEPIGLCSFCKENCVFIIIENKI